MTDQNTAERERVAKLIAFWHGQKIVMRDKERGAQTVAALRGFGMWGHSASEFAARHWRDYDAAAEAVLMDQAGSIAEGPPNKPLPRKFLILLVFGLYSATTFVLGVSFSAWVL